MKKNISRFDRTEQKYLLSMDDYRKLMDKLENHLEEDEYFRSKIANIYLDDELYSLISESMERPVFKEKMRVRSYGSGKAFVEIKRKYKGQVYKRRVAMTECEAMDFVNLGRKPSGTTEADCRIINEEEYFINFHKCRPMMYVAYDRISYKGRELPDLRITFDTDVRYRKEKLSLTDTGTETVILGAGLDFNDQDGRNLSDKKYIMEIKTNGALPLWLSEMLDSLKIYPASFSKYANAYMHMKRGESNVR